MGALDGIRVVDLSTMISGPMATRILGDQGADIIKVETPDGGDLVRHMGATQNGFSATFATANRNKRSVTADLKTPDGLEFVRRLVQKADIFVQNFRPGAIERLQLGYADVRKLKGDIIYTSISGFGLRGPFKDQRVYDPVIQALSGLAAIQADRDTGRPRMMRLVVPDKLTALTAAQAMTAALFARERTGKGQLLELSMLDATIAFHWTEGMAGHTWKGDHVKRRHSRLAQDLVFETADGFITAGAVSHAEWEGLCRAVERKDWLADERFATPGGRIAHAGERLTMLAEVLRHRSNIEWLARLGAEDVPCAPALDRESLLTHPQIVANEILHESHHPIGGEMRQPRPAEHFSETPSSIRRPAPQLGEHTEELLREVGL